MIPRRLHSPAAEAGQPAPEKFEHLLARLEQIVAEMENGEMPLEKLLASYEEGMSLVKSCGERLTDAEQKVDILARSTDAGKAPALPLTPVESAAPAKDEEISFF